MTLHSAAVAMPAHHASPKRLNALSWLAIIAGAAVLGYLVYYHIAHHEGGHGGGHVEVHAPEYWGIGILPFVGILGAIAILPLLPWTHHWWENNLNRFGVALACAGLTLAYYAWVRGPGSVLPVLDHAIPNEYIPFIILLFALYVISGGISLQGDLRAHPSTNTAFLAFGALIASFIGTTGASMLLIRPLLQTNAERRHKVHTVIFFIFLVSNIGGCLLPIGDPPLFLGYLRGVPFFWTLGLWSEWAFSCVILLVVYFIWDTIEYRRERPMDIRRDETELRPLRVRGLINILWLAGVVASVAFVVPGRVVELRFIDTSFTIFPFLRELLMLCFVGLSLLTTPKGVREANHFNYAAIAEVAALFVGIFIAMQVPIEVLRANGETLMQVMNEPWHFYWATGGLSSFLDNAPTYVVFFELARVMPAGEAAVPLGAAGAMGEIALSLLVAISLGAVFMGAMTYIGNGPNFMVKAIAEQSGVRMPSFFGYMVKYSIPVLIPVFIALTLLFLR